jgi:hypothetical protein
MGLHNSVRTIASATIVAALLAPAAYARPIDDPTGGAGPLQSHHGAQLPRPGSPALTSAQRNALTAIRQGAEQAGLHPGVFGPGGAPASRTPVVHVGDTSSGFDWGDAGVGAGALLSLTLIGLGGVLAVTRRRHAVSSSPPANQQARHARV